MVIIVQHGKWNIKWVLIDLRSYANVLFWDTFQKLHLIPNDVKVFRVSLIEL